MEFFWFGWSCSERLRLISWISLPGSWFPEDRTIRCLAKRPPQEHLLAGQRRRGSTEAKEENGGNSSVYRLEFSGCQRTLHAPSRKTEWWLVLPVGLLVESSQQSRRLWHRPGEPKQLLWPLNSRMLFGLLDFIWSCVSCCYGTSWWLLINRFLHWLNQ